VSEGIGIHLWLMHKNALAAWIFAAMNASAVIWLARDYRAMGEGVISIDEDTLHLDVGKRFAIPLRLADIAEAVKPDWRDIPEPGMPNATDYVNLMKQANPNVMLKLANQMDIPMPLNRRRVVTRIALHLDQPDSFIASIKSRMANG
jgi:hypothetical protein